MFLNAFSFVQFKFRLFQKNFSEVYGFSLFVWFVKMSAITKTSFDA